jgi:hypothetical protein
MDDFDSRINSFCKTVANYVKTNLPGFTLQVIIDHSPKRVTSRGGMYAKGPGINLALNSFTRFKQPDGTYKFNEYPSFAKDPVIGSVIGSFDKCTKALVVHEIAHAVQFYYVKINDIKNDKPHGALFKRFYADLRKEFVNERK